MAVQHSNCLHSRHLHVTCVCFQGTVWNDNKAFWQKFVIEIHRVIFLTCDTSYVLEKVYRRHTFNKGEKTMFD